MAKDQAAALRTIAAQRASQRRRSEYSRVIVVTSGKGGVGKTNISVNLGIALAEQGLRVALMDADMGLANADILLGINPPYNLAHVINGEKTIKEIMAQGPAGLKLIAGGSGMTELADISRYNLSNLVNSLQDLDDALDILLIDTGAGITSSVLSFALAGDEILVVVTPDPTSLADAYGLVKVLDRRNHSASVRIVVNMCENQKQGQEVFTKLDGVAKRFLSRQLLWGGMVPRDAVVPRAVRAFQPFYLVYPRSQAAAAIRQLAGQITAESGSYQKETVSTGIGGFFRRLFGVGK
ncbi:MAG: MinD/ParA family protein [Firmicutes bacterium]|nr:MinD/ParA family protein [Bacillota bacterium]